MFRFNVPYFIWAVMILIIEVLIALFVHDSFIRPYFGDFLVVILLYCFVKAFLIGSNWKIALAVLVFSYIIEICQYFHLVDKLGLQDNIVAKTVIGYGFEWKDLLAYTLGVIVILLIDRNNQTKTV